jgi:hypothetical protein
MRKILLFTFCFIHFTGYGQLLNKNSVWNDLDRLMLLCKSTECSGEIDNTHSYHLGRDTVINSDTFSVLIDTLYNALPYTGVEISGSIAGSIRENADTKKIYFVPKNSSEEILLYDFSLVVGDTFSVKSNWHQGEYSVTMVDSIAYLGHKRLTITITNDLKSYNWIEGVGSKQGFLYINYYDGTLLCVNDSNNLIYKNDSDYDCIKTGSLDAISETSAQNDLKVFPNPATDNVSIEKNSMIKLIEIYDLCGNKLACYSPNQNSYRITFTSLKKGIYLFKIDSEIKKLIIE